MRTDTARLQVWRRRTQTGFFILFLLAPALNLLRFDLYETQLWFLGFRWTLGIDALVHGEVSATQAALNLLLRAFLPGVLFVVVFLGIAYRYGRVYCGWLCPHFSVVETINRLMARASGKPTVWEHHRLPAWKPDGTPAKVDARWWGIVVPAAVAFAFLWAVVLLTYLLPPAEVYGNLFRGELTRNQFTFITAATVVLSLEFLFARHLFCRFVCAVGLFQSLAWMGNKDAMVVGFKRDRATDCATCLPDRQSACDAVCPMRLRPRNIKRHMFTCTQCRQCIDACAQTQAGNPDGPLLTWVADEAARQNEAGFRALKDH